MKGKVGVVEQIFMKSFGEVMVFFCLFLRPP